ncbi:MAG TPA: M56 family metallopeptidase [Verrucomicrobiae bacterium]|nr:M56 family metallopeptidase [Verrucomicrobiae bacterium]
MTLLNPWLSPATLRLLGLALMHFLWQGAALAALAYVVMALCRNAASRYAVGVVTLVLMLASPVATLVFFRAQDQVMNAAPAKDSLSLVKAASTAPATIAHFAQNAAKHQPTTAPYFPWLVELWFAGVVLLSLRSAGGILLVERLRRKETLPVTEELQEICESLQRRMGLARIIRYCESVHLDAPAVAGWIRPVVLLPVSALSGLTEAQLEAVIAHELAHIRRYDAFVNLFQVAVETLLFYHPAVWWVGKRVRLEREHCCDDEAVALCGSPVVYAHALTHLAEATQAPQLAMAANRSPLVNRVGRLLSANTKAESIQGANLSAGVLCLSAALLAGGALLGSVHQVRAQSSRPIATTVNAAVSVQATNFARDMVSATVSKAVTSTVVHVSRLATVATPPPPPNPQPQQESEASAASQKAQSYIDSLNAAGLSNLSVDELIALKVQGVTGDYVRAMKPYVTSKDGKVDVDELIGLRVQGVTSEYIKEMSAVTGENLDANDVIGMKVQGITPEYVKEMASLGLKADSGEIIGMKVQGVTPEYVKEMRSLGLNVDSGDIIGMKVQGVTPEYVKEMQQLGLKFDSGELIGMKVQGVTPEYLKELQAEGFKPDADEAIGAKIQGITPEFIAKAKSHGFNNLTLDKLIALKHAGVLDAEK